MNKYYVLSGMLRMVISAPYINTPEEAAVEACITYINKHGGIFLAPVIMVSERGFDLMEHDHNEDEAFAMIDILGKTGLLNDE